MQSLFSPSPRYIALWVAARQVFQPFHDLSDDLVFPPHWDGTVAECARINQHDSPERHLRLSLGRTHCADVAGISLLQETISSPAISWRRLIIIVLVSAITSTVLSYHLLEEIVSSPGDRYRKLSPLRAIQNRCGDCGFRECRPVPFAL